MTWRQNQAERRLGAQGSPSWREHKRGARPLAGLGPALINDLRYAARLLRRSPGFTAAAVLILALGIGANTAIFSWVEAELLRSLPYDHPAQLLVVNELDRGRIVSDTYPDFLDWRQQNQPGGGTGSFSSLAWFQQEDFNLSGSGQPEQVTGADVSGNFLRTLGVRPRLGRDFSVAADTASAPAEAILSYALFQRQFGGAPTALGRTLALNGRAYTVIGVLPPTFKDYNQTDVFVPVGVFLSQLNSRGEHDDADVIARLRSDATVSTAAAQLRAGMDRLALAYPATNTDEQAVVRPIHVLFVGSDTPMLWLLLGAVGLVLLIACANVANLTLVRTAARQRELALRLALGATRRRIARQLFVESLLLAAVGAGAGLGVARAALAGLQTLTPATPLSLSQPVLAFTALLTGAVAVLVSVGQASACFPSAHRATSRRRDGLVVAEVALALMLAAAAGLMVKSFGRLTRVNPGFVPAHVLILGASLAGPRYASDAPIAAYDREALLRLRALPGVEFAGVGDDLPLTDNHSRGDVTIAGQPLPERGHFPHPDMHDISPGYLAAMGLPLLRGRDFSDADTPTAPLVVLVNAAFARQFWPHQSEASGGLGLRGPRAVASLSGTRGAVALGPAPMNDALGQRIWDGHPSPTAHLLTIVGEVGDTHQYGLDAPPRLEVYFPAQQAPDSNPQFVLRTALPPLSLASAARAALQSVDTTAPIVGVKSMDQVVAASVSNPHTTMWLLGLFGGLALLLAAIGIYGVVSYSTQQRTQEIGIRMALGADGPSLRRLIGGESLRLIALGIAAGLAGAAASGHFLASLLYGVTPADPEVFAAVTALLLAVGLLASYVPIRRALRLQPWQALRRD